MEYVKKHQEEFYILGIKIRKEFDSIRSINLIPLLLSDKCINQQFLSNTYLTTRIQGQYGQNFPITIAAPQEDALLAIQFTFYLEMAIRSNKGNISKKYSSLHNILSWMTVISTAILILITSSHQLIYLLALRDFNGNTYSAHFIAPTYLLTGLKTKNFQMNLGKTEHSNQVVSYRENVIIHIEFSRHASSTL